MTLLDLAQPAVADELAARLVDGHRPLLAADLEDAVVLAGRLDHQPAFADREAQRLFGVDVLAGLAGVDADQRPPVLGRGGDDRVDVLAVEELAIVLHAEAAVFLRGFDGPGQDSRRRCR